MAGKNRSRGTLRRNPSGRDLKGDWFGAVRNCFQRAERALTQRTDDGVHDVRREFKRARAILRLAEDAGLVAAKSLRKEIARAARKFAGLRDARVVSILADELAHDLAPGPPSAASELTKMKGRQPGAAWWSARQNEFAQIDRRLKKLGDRKLTPTELGKSLRHSARRLRRRANRVSVHDKGRTVHEWRKQVVVMREQILFAQAPRSAEAKRLHHELEKLAHRLGEATDCRVFVAVVKKYSRPDLFAGARPTLIARTKKKQRLALKQGRQHWRKVQRMLGHALR